MREIELIGGAKAFVDDEDFERVSVYRWSVAGKRNRRGLDHRYARTYVEGRSVSMHRMIIAPQDGQDIDHRDGNGLNNVRSNLRVCSRRENARNRRLGVRSTTGFKGVTARGSSASPRWCAGICLKKGRTTYLGTFTSPEAAARAYDLAAEKHYGEFAMTNQRLGLL